MTPSSTLRIREIRFTSLSIPFKVAFRHASADRSETSSVRIDVISEHGGVGHGESCPRPYVTGETIESAHAFFLKHEASIRAQVVDLASLRAWMVEHAGAVDESPAAWCGVELAVLDLMAGEAGLTIERFLGLPPIGGTFQYTAILGDAEPAAFHAMAERYKRQGFTDFKVKLSGIAEGDRSKIELLRTWQDVRVRADANNLWRRSDEAVGFLRALDYRFFAVEEPIEAGQYSALAGMASELDCRIVVDESLVRVSQIEELPGDPDRWLINLRVSKMGGLLRSLDVVERARAARINLIVGAQVGETSLLTRAALTVAHAGRDILAAQEGAFGTHLLERDVCDPPLMFGAGGMLKTADHPAFDKPGFGLVI